MNTIDIACYLVNRSLHTKLNERIPKELWFGRKVELNHLRVFGCTTYVHVDASEQSKLDSKLKKMVFVDYPRGVKGYWLWDPLKKKTTI